MVELFLTAVVLGFVFNAAPGAVFAETVRQAVRGGFRPAFAVQAGSLVGDATWAALGLAGAGALMQADLLRVPVGFAGVAYLLWLARDAWRAADVEFRAAHDGSRAADGAPDARPHALRAGVTLSLTNPQNLGFWAAVGSATGALGVAEPGVAHYAAFFGGFMASSLVWAFVCAGALARLFRGASAGWARLTYRLCAAAFVALALASLRGIVVDVRDGAPLGQRAPAPADLSDRATMRIDPERPCAASDCRRSGSARPSGSGPGWREIQRPSARSSDRITRGSSRASSAWKPAK
jgi:chemosensory pili system protein ChpE/L-lysine exporter family protein LysE/ArgO